jgi:hypothetical protein
MSFSTDIEHRGLIMREPERRKHILTADLFVLPYIDTAATTLVVGLALKQDTCSQSYSTRATRH